VLLGKMILDQTYKKSLIVTSLSEVAWEEILAKYFLKHLEDKYKGI